MEILSGCTYAITNGSGINLKLQLQCFDNRRKNSQSCNRGIFSSKSNLFCLIYNAGINTVGVEIKFALVKRLRCIEVLSAETGGDFWDNNLISLYFCPFCIF